MKTPECKPGFNVAEWYVKWSTQTARRRPKREICSWTRAAQFVRQKVLNTGKDATEKKLRYFGRLLSLTLRPEQLLSK